MQEPGTEGTVQAPVPFAPHSTPEAPRTRQMLLRRPLPVVSSAPPPSEAFQQCSLQCFLLAPSSSAEHQAPSHPFQQAFEGTSSSLHDLRFGRKQFRSPFSQLPFSSQAHSPKSAPKKPHAFTSLEGTSAPALSGLHHLAASFP